MYWDFWIDRSVFAQNTKPLARRRKPAGFFVVRAHAVGEIDHASAES
jgi:hypothetical protein